MEESGLTTLRMALPVYLLGYYSVLSHRTPGTEASRAMSVSTFPSHHVCHVVEDHVIGVCHAPPVVLQLPASFHHILNIPEISKPCTLPSFPHLEDAREAKVQGQ